MFYRLYRWLRFQLFCPWPQKQILRAYWAIEDISYGPGCHDEIVAALQHVQAMLEAELLSITHYEVAGKQDEPTSSSQG